MPRLRTRLVVQLLLATAITGNPGCDPCGDGGWSTQALELPANLPAHATVRRAFAVPEFSGVATWLVGDAGLVVRVSDSEGPTLLPRPALTDLHGIVVTGDEIVVVGAGGTLRVGDPSGNVWTAVDLGTTADLFHITRLTTRFGDFLVTVGDDVMFARDVDGGDWRPVPAPAGGFGPLRGVGRDLDDSVFAVGLGGLLWSAPDVSGPWTRVDLGLTADLTAISPPEAAAPLIGGSDRTLLAHGSDGWRPIEPSFTGDIADITDEFLLTTHGEVFSLDFHPLSLEQVAGLGLGMYALSSLSHREVLVLGRTGNQVRITGSCPDAGGL